MDASSNAADDGWDPLLLNFIAQTQHMSPQDYRDPNVASPPPPATVTEALSALSDFHAKTVTDKTSFLHGRIITIGVGPEEAERKWSVHEPLLSAKSPFFQRLLNGDAEGQAMTEVKFRQIKPKLFSMFMNWLYGTTFGPSAGTRIFRFPIPDGKNFTVSDYIHLYLLGVSFEIVGVKNAAIDAVYGYFYDENEVRCPDIFDVQMVFKSTDEDTPMRRLLIAHCLFYFFKKKRVDFGHLPNHWLEAFKADPSISCALLEMLAEWGWNMGGNVPPMKIKNRQSFHDPIDVDVYANEAVKREPRE
ncbi:hypothetical protein B0T14DRAFT_557336 [Immersiella caudata]|uniref:BTB domain-containing protein n=1 Tax=Immersiella caudata TaxID=314043 RepID=A0AA40BUA4_9PEZI|nr:hypothetical protein B0T14DRAFT_557336 [Immersiella caudata]